MMEVNRMLSKAYQMKRLSLYKGFYERSMTIGTYLLLAENYTNIAIIVEKQNVSGKFSHVNKISLKAYLLPQT